MKAKEIRKIFADVAIDIPKDILSIIKDEEWYNLSENYCCGIKVDITLEGKILVREYCHRGRGGKKIAWLVDRNGNCEKIGELTEDWLSWCNFVEVADIGSKQYLVK